MLLTVYWDVVHSIYGCCSKYIRDVALGIRGLIYTVCQLMKIHQIYLRYDKKQINKMYTFNILFSDEK